MRVPRTPITLGLLLFLAASGTAAAHDFTVTDALVIIKANRTYQVDLTLDIDALAMNVTPRLHTPELFERLQKMNAAEKAVLLQSTRQRITERFQLRFDNQLAQPMVTFPDYDSLALEGNGRSDGDARGVAATANSTVANPIAMSQPSVFGVTVRLSGTVPSAAHELTFGGNADAGVIQLTILDQASASGVKHLLPSDSISPPFPLDGSAARVADGNTGWTLSRTIAEYFVLGFEHILPKGLDHILFVLGLFLLSTGWRPLLIQVSAFTVAHTLTLALSIYGIVHLPSRLVETVIALSIAYVALENVFTSTLHAWRPALVFIFGLLHGLGFAGVLKELGLPRDQFMPALLSFNVGVEAGQLTVIAIAALLLGWWRHRPWYRRGVVIPASLLIAAVGLYWAVQRALGLA